MNIEIDKKRETEEREKNEFSFLLVKPNAIKLGLTGLIRQDLIEEGFEIIHEEQVEISGRSAEVMYHELGTKKNPVIEHITAGKSYVFMAYGKGVIRRLREAVGHTDWKDRPSKGLRGKYAQNHIENSVHAPDSHREVVLELTHIFPDIAEKVLRSQLATELVEFLNDREAIENGERFVNQYSV